MKINSPNGDSSCWSNLENTLAQLEADQRREDLAFWKDATEIKGTAFENTMEHEKVRDRAYILGSILPDAFGEEDV